MVRWARNDNFDGGFCGHCHPKDTGVPGCATPSAQQPKGVEHKNCSASTLCSDCSKKEREERVSGEQV